MIVNASGGGAGLNFKIVGGTAQPGAGGDTLTWDGNTEGLVNVMGMFFKLSDAVLSVSDCVNGGICRFESIEAGEWQETFDSSTVFEMADGVLAVTQMIFSIHESAVGVEIDGIAFPEKGTYFALPEGLVSASLTIPGYTGFGGSAAPKENTIWVNTSTTITGWIFSVTEPQSPSEGIVWIKTSDTSPVAFNAIKKNNVMIYPWSCYQYINGAWVKKPAKSYIGGEWKTWAQYLFNLGDENTALTGGWKGYAVRLASGSDGAQAAEAPLVAKQSNGGIKLYNDYGGGIHRCVNKINLSGYDVLTLNGEMYNHNANKNWCSLYVWSAIGTYYPQNVAASVGPSSGALTGDITLDISSLNGEYYVGFGLHDNTNDNYIIMNSLVMS